MAYTNPYEGRDVVRKILLNPWAKDRFRFKGTPEILADNDYVEKKAALKLLRAESLIGLTSGFGLAEKFEPELLRDELMDRWAHGGTVIVQLGWWGGSPEKSAKAVIINMDEVGRQLLHDDEFKDRMRKLFKDIGRVFRQQFVPLYFLRDGAVEDADEFTWQPE